MLDPILNGRTLLCFSLPDQLLGGGDWQRDMIGALRKHNEDFLAVTPCRYGETDSIRHDHVSFYKTGIYERQTDWERHYLEWAAHKGCIIFWLGCESKTNPRDDGSPYARDTYGELGEWRGRLMHDPTINLVIGAEQDFPGLSVIHRNFKQSINPGFRIHSTMEDVARAAIQKSHP